MVTGWGFTRSGAVTVSYAETIITIGRADHLGAFDIAATVPDSAAIGSTHVVEAIDDVTGRTVSADHRVPPASLSLEPVEGFPGTTFTMSGQGFPASATVKPIVFDGSDISSYPYATTDGSGAFAVQLAAPRVPSREVTVSATAGGSVARASFNVLPATLGLTLSAGPPNTAVIVHGWSFPASSEIGPLDMGGVDVLTDAVNLRDDLGLRTTVWGTFSVEITVPVIPSGDADVSAEVAGVRASAIFAVPPMVVDTTPAEGPRFSTFTVRATGFPVSTRVASVTIGEVELLGFQGLETDADGVFELRAPVPSFPPGPVQVSVTVGTVTSSTSFLVTS